MNNIGIIPARMASSRFPGKPLVRICGMPMVGHVYYRSRLCGLLNNVYIATCDKEIADYAASIGAPCIMTAKTHERASDRAAEAMLKIENDTGKKVDIAVMIQGDEPMIFPEMIEDAIKPLLKDETLQITNLMGAIKTREDHEDANVVKVVTDGDSCALYFSREPIPSRKKFFKEFPMNKQIAIIPFRRNFLIKFNKLEPMLLEIIESVDMLRVLEHGYKVKMVPTPMDIYGVDIPEHVGIVERMMKRDRVIPKYEVLLKG